MMARKAVGETHRDHVLGDHLAKPDAGVEAFADDVGETVIGE